jgi:hypothetical protein
VLKIYMDESGVHNSAPVVAVAAYISRPKYWRAWIKDWNKAKKPINVYHATDCANLRREFASWDKARRDAYVANLLPVIPAHELAGVLIGIDMNVFRQEGRFDHHGDRQPARQRRAHALYPRKEQLRG